MLYWSVVHYVERVLTVPDFESRDLTHFIDSSTEDLGVAWSKYNARRGLEVNTAALYWVGIGFEPVGRLSWQVCEYP
jgi:hypothetical protein